MTRFDSHVRFAALCLLFAVLALAGCHATETAAEDRPAGPPNILILTADDLNYDSIGVFGCKVPAITPNIDRLASQGVRFTHAHVNTAVCQPCRQSWMTGRFPHNNGAEGFEPIDPDVPTLPAELKKLGYLNGILGKEIHHQPTEQYAWDFIPFKTEDPPVWRHGHARHPELFHRYSGKFFEMAKAQDRPFFLIANSHDPHRPFIGNDARAWGDHPLPVTRTFTPEQIEMFGYLPDIPKVREEVAQYFGNVYRCDENIGSVLRALKESGLEDNTLVIFLADHGAAFPFAKAQCYLNSTQTPLIVKWPGKVKPGTVDEEHFVTGIDLMPTVLQAVGLAPPAGLEGESLVPLLKGEDQAGRDYAFSTFYQIFARVRYPMRKVQGEDFAYIYNFWADGELGMTGDSTGGITWRAMIEAGKRDPAIAERVELYRHRVPEEFYDVKNDPDGLNNLANDPAYADALARYQKQMLAMMKQYKDPAYEAYRERNTPGVIEAFMADQREKAEQTGRNTRF
ncbi:MAG: sulfatase [Phycisphaeraceae bacterium]